MKNYFLPVFALFISIVIYSCQSHESQNKELLSETKEGDLGTIKEKNETSNEIMYDTVINTDNNPQSLKNNLPEVTEASKVTIEEIESSETFVFGLRLESCK